MRGDEKEEALLLAVRRFTQSLNSSQNVSADMSAVVDASACLPLSKLGQWERLIRSEYASALEKTKSPKWKFWVRREELPAREQQLTWLDLASYDGYRREKTLRTLSGPAPNSLFFALAMRRLNDWVPQVRLAAREALPGIAKSSSPEHIVDALWVSFSNWISWGRLEEVDRQVILNIACLNKVSRPLISRIISATCGPGSTILAQIGRTEILDPHLDDIASSAVQPSVRAKAYRSLLEGKIVWLERREFKWTDVHHCKGRINPVLSERKLICEYPFLPMLKQASSDRSPMVRRVAGELLIKELPSIGAEAADLAKLLANDSSPSVAERGQFALNRLAT